MKDCQNCKINHLSKFVIGEDGFWIIDKTIAAKIDKCNKMQELILEDGIYRNYQFPKEVRERMSEIEIDISLPNVETFLASFIDDPNRLSNS